MCALSNTMLKERGEAMFGEVVGRVSGVVRGRAREGVAILLSKWLLKSQSNGISYHPGLCG